MDIRLEDGWIKVGAARCEKCWLKGMKAIDKVGSAFLRRILHRMKQLGVSQTELARRMKVSRPYVTKVLSRDVNFSFRTAAKLANALKMDFFPELRERETGGEPSSHPTGRGVSPTRPPDFQQTPVTAKLRKMV